MFGIDDALIWGPLIGAAAGGLLNRRNPMQGALLGAGLGLGGGLLAPQAGAITAAEAAAGTGLAAPGAAAGQTGLTLGGSGMGLAAPASAMQVPGNLAMAASGTPTQIAGQGSTSLLGTINKYKPVMDAAMQARQMAGDDTPTPQIAASPMTPTNVSTGPNGLAQLAMSNNQVGQNIQDEAALRRARRMRQLAMMGGGNGLA